MSSGTVGVKTPKLLGPHPRSGQLSPHAAKSVNQIIVLVASIVVWGSITDVLVSLPGNGVCVGSFSYFGASQCSSCECEAACIYVLVASAFTTIILLALSVVNNRAEAGAIVRAGIFHLRNEILVMMFLSVWWTPIVAVITALCLPVTPTGAVFSWVAFLGSIYGVLSVYHAVREEEAQTAYNSNLEALVTTTPQPYNVPKSAPEN